MTARCREVAVGDRVRILDSGLGAIVEKKWRDVDLEVVDIMSNGWIKVTHPHSNVGTSVLLALRVARVDA